MNSSSPDRGPDRWRELMDRSLLEGLDDAQSRELEAALLAHREAREDYRLRCNVDTALRAESAVRAQESEPATRGWLMTAGWRPWAAVAGLAVMASLGVWVTISRPATCAELIDAQEARWEGSTLPTEPGSRLGQGKIRLVEGLARLRFSRGAEVTLEGPVELELLGPQTCRLHHGALVAHVPEAARGFSVLTRSATLVDHGTDFGISTDVRGHARVHVLQGEVELRHTRGLPPLRLTTREMAEITPEQLLPVRPLESEPRTQGTAGAGSGYAAEISTRTGGGAATYVSEPRTMGNQSDTLLLLKHCAEEGYGRKVLLRFDLQSLPDTTSISESRLILNLGPTGLGYASQGGQARIGVYALTNDAADHWQPETVTWMTQPAFHPDAGRVDETQAKRIGEIVIPRGVQNGPFSLDVPELTARIKSDTNQLLTLLLVRENRIDEKGGLVLGIAGNRHPMLPPPTLRVR